LKREQEALKRAEAERDRALDQSVSLAKDMEELKSKLQILQSAHETLERQLKHSLEHQTVSSTLLEQQEAHTKIQEHLSVSHVTS
jgi:hypothetical protein